MLLFLGAGAVQPRIGLAQRGGMVKGVLDNLLLLPLSPSLSLFTLSLCLPSFYLLYPLTNGTFWLLSISTRMGIPSQSNSM